MPYNKDVLHFSPVPASVVWNSMVLRCWYTNSCCLIALLLLPLLFCWYPDGTRFCWSCSLPQFCCLVNIPNCFVQINTYRGTHIWFKLRCRGSISKFICVVRNRYQEFQPQFSFLKISIMLQNYFQPNFCICCDLSSYSKSFPHKLSEKHTSFIQYCSLPCIEHNYFYSKSASLKDVMLIWMISHSSLYNLNIDCIGKIYPFNSSIHCQYC